MNGWAQGEGCAGLGYATRKGGEWGGPIAKNHGPDKMDALAAELGLGPYDGLFFAAGKEAVAAKVAGLARRRVAEQRDRHDAQRFENTGRGSRWDRVSPYGEMLVDAG